MNVPFYVSFTVGLVQECVSDLPILAHLKKYI